MPKFRAVALASATLLLLSGCSVFYPNWGATGLPEEQTLEPAETPSETVTETPEPTDNEVENEQTASPEPTESESAEPEIVRSNAEVSIIMAIPDPDFGVLSIVAEILGFSENDGVCTMRFIGSDQEHTADFAAEPSSDYTVCAYEYPLADLPSGDGIITISYLSERHEGVSRPVSVVIP